MSESHLAFVSICISRHTIHPATDCNYTLVSMGKSAKLHKRVPKKVKSSTSSSANQNTSAAASSSRNQVEQAKKKSKAKSKGSSTSEKGVLGGADYLAILHGSRKRAMEEAKKLPRDD
ncbi:hypothetical protein CPC08DRAFT_725544 [Agrocybe pediades]|nr:hypothetical protein CPC08DRAFT_725544 [Agrocybe pediades]